MPKTSVLISGFAAVVAVGGLGYWVVSGDETLGPRSTVPIPALNKDNQNPNAVANQWQWENFTETQAEPKPITEGEKAKEDETQPASEVPFDVVKIYHILQDIQLDENGLVVPDQAAKYALEKAFDDFGPDLSPEAMAELQELIRIGLPGEAGEQSARILENYYEFRLAEEEFNRQVEQEMSQPDSQANSLDRYEELMELRRRYLGNDIADQLFAMENAQARHMFATFEIQQNADLTDEEKQAELAALQEKLNKRLLSLGEMKPEEAAAEEVKRLRENGASDAEIYTAREEILGPTKAQELAEADREEARWQSRFDGFWQARQRVLDAGLAPDEKERQIEQLLGQYFNAEEMERAQLTTLEWQSRERQ